MFKHEWVQVIFMFFKLLCEELYRRLEYSDIQDKNVLEDWGGSSVRRSICKHENLSSNPSAHSKSQACLCISVSPVLEGGDRWSWALTGQGTIQTKGSVRLFFFKGVRQRAVKKTAGVFLWSPPVHSHSCTTCVRTQTHTHLVLYTLNNCLVSGLHNSPVTKSEP